jgi:hypothetical protein
MKYAILTGFLVFIVVGTFAAPAPSDSIAGSHEASVSPPASLTLFAPAQFDSIVGLLPGGDTLRNRKSIVSIGADQATGDMVVITLDASGTPVKTVYPRATIKTLPAAQPADKPARHDQNGRTWFIVESVLKSASIYPVSFANAFEGANGQSIAGFSLLMVGGTLYGTYAFTKNMELGYGKTSIINYGTTMFGTYYPLLIKAFLTGTTDLDKFPTKTVTGPGDYSFTSTYGIPPTDKILAWSSMIGFPLGMIIGSRANLVGKDDFGRAALMEWFSQSAGGLGFALPLFFMDPGKQSDAYLTVSSLLSMTALPAGLAAGKSIFGATAAISAGRGVLPGVSGMLGTLTGISAAMLPDYTGIDDIGVARITTGLGIAGWGAGTLLGLKLHPSIDYSFWQAVFTGVSSCAGTVMGVALPLIAQSNQRQPYILCGIAGGWTGFFVGEKLSRSLFEKSDRDRHASTLRFNLPGLAALPVILTTTGRSPSKATAAALWPMAGLAWRF